MAACDFFDRWAAEPTRKQESLVDRDTTSWLVSLVTHVVVLVTVGLLQHTQPLLRNELTLLVPQEQETEELEQLDESFEVSITQYQLPEIGAPSLGIVEKAAAPPVGDVSTLPNPADVADTSFQLSGTDALTELFSNNRSALLEDLAGIPGMVVSVSSDLGSVDRITTEILARLQQSEVLVVWLMDASESLRARREQIIQRFDRIYDELDTLADDPGDALLTGVAAFGKELVPMLPEPTADRAAIKRSVREIKADESGIENVFSAIKLTAQACTKYIRSGRKAMIVVVTDEMGNDLPVLDEAAQLVKRNQIAVYVIGPLAPFGSRQVRVKWADEATGQVYFLPVDRGPETAQVEHAALALWQGGPGSGVLSSGFGPYGLTQITHENGGLYLLYDDGSIRGPSFDVQDLSWYHPDYVSPDNYERLVAKNPLRAAVVRTAQASNHMLKKPMPTLFLAAGIQFEIRDVRKDLAKVEQVLYQGLKQLRAVEKYRARETSKRWQAHYDLLMGRLLADRVRCRSYSQLLDEMYKRPKVPKDGTKNAWKLVAADPPGPATGTRSSDKDGREAESARAYLQRVVDQHAKTPWAVIAQSELEFPLRFRWEEAFKVPPEGVPLPWDKKPWRELTDAEKKAKLNFEKQKKQRQKRKQQAAKKNAGAKRRPPPKL